MITLTPKARRKAIDIVSLMETIIEESVKNCGIGADGFEDGNTCARGGDGGSGSAAGKKVDIESHAVDVEKKLDSTTKAAFKHYSEDIGYDINQTLRGGDDLTGDEHKVASLMSKAIQEHGELPESVKVYRAMSWSHEQDKESFLESIKDGGLLQLKGFTSTSTDKGFVAEAFGGRRGGNVLIEISAKKGIYLGSDAMSHHVNQKELLLDNNSHFKVLKVEGVGGGSHVVYLEQIS